MTSLLVWSIVGAPMLAAALAPIVSIALGRSRFASSAYYVLGHTTCLGLAVLALRATAPDVMLRADVNRLGLQVVLTLDRGVGEEVLVAAFLFLAVSAFSAGFVRGIRHGTVFLGLLFLEQAAVNLVLVADNLLVLYAGLVVLSISLMVMLGLDFAAPGGSAALRVFATLEVPAAVALARVWVGDAQIGTIALADLARQAPWLAQPSSLVVCLPIAVALLSRAGLAPLQHWVVVGCRAAAAPVAVALTGLALPVGAIVLIRVLTSGSLDPVWPRAAEVVGGLTALVAAVGALRERTALGWLAYAAVAQIGFTVVGFASTSPLGVEAGWLTLGAGTLAVTLTGLGLAQTMRATGHIRPVALVDLPPEWVTRVALGIGYAALAPLPPFASFAARRLLVGALLADGSPIGRVLGVGIVLATLLLAASVWRAMFGAAAPARPASRETAPEQAGWDVRGVLAILTALTVAGGVIPLAWLIDLAAGPTAPVVDEAGRVVAASVVGLMVGLAVGWRWLAERSTGARSRPAEGSPRWPGTIGRVRLDAALDPYLVVGALLLGLGRLSALVLNNTLGRLVRAG